jgi:CTP-dependent riboflavin kinase
MTDKLTVTGKIVSGGGKGAFFMQLGWVQKQCREKLGFNPFPGTLNLEVDEKQVPLIAAVHQKGGLTLEPPDSNFCTGHIYPASIMGVTGAIVAPADDVRAHADNILELIAPTSLKDALDVGDGDEIMLVIAPPLN